MSTIVPLGTLRAVGLRTVWPHEAIHFSRWLGENLSALGAALELDLELTGSEAPVGRFALDLLARVAGTEEVVVVENQLERTNHDHLGKLLTYAAGFDAAHIIWITSEFCEEHRAALDWLNNNTASNRNFFGVQVEAIQIDDSRPAISFKVVVKPNAWQKSTSQVAREAAGSADQEPLLKVFDAIHAAAKSGHQFARLLRPNPGRAYYVLERTHGSVEYSAAFSRDSIRAEVILNFSNHDVNVYLFRALKKRESAIEELVGPGILWDLADDRRRQALRLSYPFDRQKLEENIDEVASWTVGKLTAFRAALEPAIAFDVEAALANAALAASDVQTVQ